MADRIYPRMSYHVEWPDVPCQVIADVTHDMRMGQGWDDPYGVRSATADLPSVETVTEPVETSAPAIERKKPGRKPKVQV